MKQFKLPDPGEGLVEAEIITWHVKVGDQVKINDILLEIETSKSLVELPSPYAGTVTALLVEEGQTVEVGTPIITIDDGVDDAPAPAPAAPGRPTTQDAVTQDSGDQDSVAGDVQDDAAPGPMLVGYGPKGDSGQRRRRRASSAEEPSAGQQLADSYRQAVPSRRADDVTPPHTITAEAHGDPLPEPGEAPHGTDMVLVGVDGPILAKPPVRKYAKTLGVDLSTVTGTGPGGVITRGDVEAAAALQQLWQQEAQRPRNSWVGEPGEPHVQDPQTSSTHGGSGPRLRGGEKRVPFKGVRKVTAEAVAESIVNHVHVTEWITVDVTATMQMVERLRSRRDFAHLRVSPLLVYAKAVCLAMANTPIINSSYDAETNEIVLHDDVNLGIAAATPRGLMVPNIKGASRMSLLELCESINSLVQVAKEGRLQPADYSGGTFTITNVGVFGIDSGTPIINRDESAILCMGSIERRPWVVGSGADERIEPRWVTTVSITFDHKLIDGEQGSRFLAEVAGILNDPQLALLY
ncbi:MULTISPECIES: dihydrolipoamide acetyltransferase family protein [Aestuariimicrobium]|uniref:dihydrolipoamide acetyltransferase family protein n=1 Tax=Aestuariimicrobium TaxID=396388 RepID=UPI0003B4CDFB|nr:MULTISPECIES: dihydrolipoamide acetyltransferase family protein [Aestuariimicrobium]CAI9402598.1 Dihydrolipoyllysine-residue acetyltransferase component of pyruvate dehydrogenase complex [Aestuariimicrobium sp. T2.26MG-19.2B]